MPLNPLGVPETDADWQFVSETIARRSPVPPVGADLERVHVAFLNGLAKDMQPMEATGRWLFSRSPNRQPVEYVPGDPTVTASTWTPPPRTKTSGCHSQGGLPDPACTPGAIDPRVSRSDINSTICTRGYTTTVRPPLSVTEPIKRERMAAY
jgi:hypothetical protein